ncbi:mechanosensitive ion channel family protein, partial [Chloroflexota bacterium]
MLPGFIEGSPLLEGLWVVGILIIFSVAAWLISQFIKRTQMKLRRPHRTTLLPQLLQSVSRPVVILVLIEGVILALGSISSLESWAPALIIASVSMIIVIVTYGIARSGGVLLVWYLRTQGFRKKAKIDEGLVSFLRRISTILVYAIGLLILLDYLNISVTPILTGLGIAGLAVALALQPTLSNFFASTQIVSDRVVRVGDFIELENEISGY